VASQAIAVKEAEEHFQCLDLLHVKESAGVLHDVAHCAILLEFWRSGALLHTSEAIPAGTQLEISFEAGFAAAQVDSCTQEEFGYIVAISIDTGEAWSAYCPPYVLDSESRSVEKSPNGL
jgi:hypothetical protein